MELWKNIKGYEDKYLISNYGRVKTLSRPIFRKNGKIHYMQKERLLNPSLLPVGYKYIGLHNNGKYVLKTVHSLVAEHFIENIGNKRTVNHKDGNKQNNHVDNLEWATDTENIIHAYSTGLKKRYGVVAINPITNNEVKYDCVSDAVKCGYKQSCISKSITNNKPYNGYLWKYYGENFGSSIGSKQKQDMLNKMNKEN